jgi:hypothetical protein
MSDPDAGSVRTLKMRGNVVTNWHRRGITLMAVAIVVAGLAISAPPGLGMAGNHEGLLLHPIFPHRHVDGHVYPAHDLDGHLASHEASSADVAPGLSVPLSASVAKDAAAGVAIPFTLAALVVGRAVTPPTPPPRTPRTIV